MCNYILLGATGLVLLAIAWRRGNLPVKVSLYLVCGVAMNMADLLVQSFLEAYAYRPQFWPIYPQGNYFGLALSDYLLVPSLISSLLGASGRYLWLKGALLTIPVLLIELSFTQLGLFVPFTWQLWHSAVLFTPYFMLAGLWAERFQRLGYTGIRRTILRVTMIIYPWWMIALTTDGILDLWKAYLRIVAYPIVDNVVGGLLLGGMPLLAVAIPSLWRKWYRSFGAMLAVAGGGLIWHYGLYYFGFTQDRFVWVPALRVLTMMLVISVSGWLDEWFTRRASPHAPHETAGAL